jgi:sigma-B regulation protein RsbU (phosphoserine phosphatase)
MADRQFSSKPHSSLAWRILFICMALLVFPLICDSLLVYVHEYQARMRTFSITLQLTGQGQVNLINEIVCAELDKLASPESDAPLLSPESGPFTPFLHQAMEKGWVVFAGVEPKSLEKNIYIGKAEPGGVRLAAVPAERFVETLVELPGRPFDFHMGILLPNGALFYSDDPDFSLKEVFFLKSPDLGSRFFEILWKGFDRVGIQLPWPGSDLSLVFVIATTALIKTSAFEWLSNFLLTFFAIFFIGCMITYLATRRMAKPLNALFLEMKKVEGGDLTARYQPDRFGLEINTLGQSFNQMIDAIVHHMERSEQERLAKEALATELKIGQEIQKSLLPNQIVEFPGLDIAAGFLAAQEVAGDFYDLFEAKGQLLIAVADGSGKGISACLYSLGVRSLLRSFFLSYSSLKEVLLATNRTFYRDAAETSQFVTAWVASYDPKTKRLDFGNAGHPPGLLRRKEGIIEELTTRGIALGASDQDLIETSSVQLASGDLLLLYSDGITEEHNPEGKMFGNQPLFDILKNHKGTAAELLDKLFNEVEQFCSGTPHHDDITVVIFEVL